MQAVLRRGLAFAVLWWVLAEGRADSWGVGVMSIALAVTVSLRLLPPQRSRLSIAGLLKFTGFFLLHSVKGGVQVAAMALRPAPHALPRTRGTGSAPHPAPRPGARDTDQHPEPAARHHQHAY